MRSDSSEFEKKALPHLNLVYRTAVALCGQADLAEDLTQSTFMKALERFETFRADTNCKAWLLQILRHLWIDRLRHGKVVGTVVALEEELLGPEQSIQEEIWTEAQDVLEHFADEEVIQALRTLPEEQRLTLFLMDVEQLSQQEVAEITGVAVGTVKSRTSRARSALKERLLRYAKERGLVRGES